MLQALAVAGLEFRLLQRLVAHLRPFWWHCGACLAGLLPILGIFHQFRIKQHTHIHRQRVRQALDVLDRDISQSSLDAADVRAVQVRGIPQNFLGQAPRIADQAQVGREQQLEPLFFLSCRDGTTATRAQSLSGSGVWPFDGRGFRLSWHVDYVSRPVSKTLWTMSHNCNATA